MAGLYVHIPFCASRCVYCGFYSTVHTDLRQRYVDAVCREMELRPATDAIGAIETVYLGGGTPSQLSVAQLEQLFYYINKVYRPACLREVTMECNPDDVTDEFATGLRLLPVDRISMGAQTFSDRRLRFLHRRHTASQVGQAVERLRTAGIGNISIDLMYGFPDETLQDWECDINAALAVGAEHLSAYCLTYEAGTPLYQQLQRGAIHELDEETERAMYEMLIHRLTSAGYEHYEISNFARPGRRSLHNSSYWNDVPYIGLGAAAHSYLLTSRSWNIADIQQYIESIERGVLPSESESIDATTHYNDRIVTALRTCDGLDLNTLTAEQRTYCLSQSQRFVADGLLRIDGSRLLLTRRGLFVSDMVMSELLQV
ncbi:MAG: radical SAM family heme chaperone HemW [Prevotella sp.]|nr:radical SAM family heme chaperone HemW [Prevotella sp.]